MKVFLLPSTMKRGKLTLPSRIANPWLLFSWIYRLTATATEELDQKKRLDEFTRHMIRKRRDAVQREAVVGERKSLLDYMLEISDSNPDFTEQDIVNEACTFMLAVSRPENYSRSDFSIFRFLSSSLCRCRVRTRSELRWRFLFFSSHSIKSIKRSASRK